MATMSASASDGRLVGRRVADPDLEGPGRDVDPADLGRAQLGVEAQGLGPHDAHELGAHDPVDEAGVVLDLGGQHQLAAGLVAGGRGLALDDEGVELGAGGVEGGGEAGRPAPDDDDLARAQASARASRPRREYRMAPTATEEEPEHDVGGPDPVPGDGGQADEPDAEEDHDGDADDGDDDAEDDAAGGHDGRADGLVVDGGDHGVDRVEGTVRTSASEMSFSATARDYPAVPVASWQARCSRRPPCWARRGCRPPGRGRPGAAGARWRCPPAWPGRRRSRRRRRRPRRCARAGASAGHLGRQVGQRPRRGSAAWTPRPPRRPSAGSPA